MALEIPEAITMTEVLSDSQKLELLQLADKVRKTSSDPLELMRAIIVVLLVLNDNIATLFNLIEEQS